MVHWEVALVVLGVGIAIIVALSVALVCVKKKLAKLKVIEKQRMTEEMKKEAVESPKATTPQAELSDRDDQKLLASTPETPPTTPPSAPAVGRMEEDEEGPVVKKQDMADSPAFGPGKQPTPSPATPAGPAHPTIAPMVKKAPISSIEPAPHAPLKKAQPSVQSSPLKKVPAFTPVMPKQQDIPTTSSVSVSMHSAGFSMSATAPGGSQKISDDSLTPKQRSSHSSMSMKSERVSKQPGTPSMMGDQAKKHQLADVRMKTKGKLPAARPNK